MLSAKEIFRRRCFILAGLLLILPCGFAMKVYSGPGSEWAKAYGAGMLYEMFWIFFLVMILPRRKAIIPVAAGVFLVTCLLEGLQLWHPPFLQAIRSNYWGRTLIGDTFSWEDFPNYAAGCLLAVLILVPRLKEETRE